MSSGDGVVRRVVGIVAGAFALAALAFVPNGLHDVPGMGHRPAYAAGVAALMALWWLTEALPIALTACVPLVLFPLLGVFGGGPFNAIHSSVVPYFDAYIFLFMGGMTIGAAMEESHLHKRIALHIMRRVGTRPPQLLAGMLLATAIVSMWISNTATAVMMLPIAMALLRQMEAQTGGEKLKGFGAALMLAVAWACNIGGIGTKVGTGTNSIFAGFAARTLHRDIGFVEYIVASAPFVVIMLPLAWLVLWRLARVDARRVVHADDLIAKELTAMGPTSRHERVVIAVFCGAALLWVLADVLRPKIAPLVPVPWEGFTFAGKHYEASVAMTAALLLVALRAVHASTLRRVPWDTLVLLGGSFALAAGLEGSGFSSWMAERLTVLASWPVPLQLLAANAATIFLSAVASNTATINVMLTVLPRNLPMLFGATLAASCDFALPAGTPPNAIVFGSGYIRLPVMMMNGAILDVVAAVVTTLYVLWYVPLVLQ